MYGEVTLLVYNVLVIGRGAVEGRQVLEADELARD